MFTQEQRVALTNFEQALQEYKQPTEDAKLREQRRQAVEHVYARCVELCTPDALTKAEHAAVRIPGL